MAAKKKPIAQVNRYQRAVEGAGIVVDRSAIKFHPKNPRDIDAYALDRLCEVIKKHGVSGLVWNKRSGYLLGGHQRVKALDKLHGHKNYKLAVAVVDLDDVAELELIVVLNSTDVQGFFVPELLGDVLHEIQEKSGLDVDGLLTTVGLEPVTLQTWFEGTAYEAAFPPSEAAAARYDAEDAARAGEDAARAGSAGATAKVEAELAGVRPADKPTPQETAKRNRAKMKTLHGEDDDAETYIVIQCHSRAECQALAPALGAPADARTIDGAAVMRKLGVQVTKE